MEIFRREQGIVKAFRKIAHTGVLRTAVAQQDHGLSFAEIAGIPYVLAGKQLIGFSGDEYITAGFHENADLLKPYAAKTKAHGFRRQIGIADDPNEVWIQGFFDPLAQLPNGELLPERISADTKTKLEQIDKKDLAKYILVCKGKFLCYYTL